MDPKSEERIQEAMFQTAAGAFSSLGQACKDNDAKKSTAYHRRAGRVPRNQVHRKDCRLTKD